MILLNAIPLSSIPLNAFPLNIKMRNIKQTNIKNRTYYFSNDIINIKDFDSSLLKIGKKSYKDIGIHNIAYITIKKKLVIMKMLTV